MELDNFSISAKGTKSPFSPERIISDGPLGQSKETHGSPQLNASIRTSANPSYLELNT